MNHRRRNDALFWMLAFALLYGCKAARLPMSNATGESLERSMVRGDSAQRHVEAVIPDVSGGNKVHLQSADLDLTWQRGDLLDTKMALAAERVQYSKLYSSFDALNHRWYVIWGRRIQWVIGIAVGMWVAAGIAAAIIGPTGIGIFLMRLLPLSNVWVALRNRFHPGTRLVPVTVNQ